MSDTVSNLRKEYSQIYQSAFTDLPADEYICRACGQELPPDKREQLLSDARSSFEQTKAAKLKEIAKSGEAAKEALGDTSSKLELEETLLGKAHDERDRIAAELDTARAEEERLTPTGNIDYAADPEVTALTERIAALSAELENPPADIAGDITAKRDAVNARMAGYVKTLSERDAAERARKIIADYSARERELSDQITELDGQLFMLETYVKTEASLLETSINAKFKTIRFRLFEEQINGGLRPTCEAVVNGIQFSEANTADQFNAGMEIIDALCRHYNVYAPVFVDRCESINRLTPIESQVIRLSVVSDEILAELRTKPGAVGAHGARGELCIQIEKLNEEAA